MGIWIPGGLSSSGGGGYVPCSWSDGTDEEIVEALEQHYAGNCDLHEYWSVGDERTVQMSDITDGYTKYSLSNEALSQVDTKLVLVNSGGQNLSTGIQCAFIVLLYNYRSGYKQGISTYYLLPQDRRWDASYNERREWLNDSLYNAFPVTLKPIFKQFIYKWFSTDFTDYFTIPSVINTLGDMGYDCDTGEIQLDYFKTSSNKLADSYWTKTQEYRSSYSYCIINNQGNFYGTMYPYSSGYTYAIYPIGCI